MFVKWSLSFLAGLGFLLLCEGQWKPEATRLCEHPLEESRNLKQFSANQQNDGSSQSGNRCYIYKPWTCKISTRLNNRRCCEIEEVSEILGDNETEHVVQDVGKSNPARIDQVASASSHTIERQSTSTLQPQNKFAGRRDNRPKGGMSQVWAFLTGILVEIVIGVTATSVACCCLAESIADCRKHSCNNGCHCCRADNHVTVEQSPEPAGPPLTSQNLAVQDVSIYNEADAINTPRVGRRPVSEHPYDYIPARHDPSQYDIINNGTNGQMATGITSSTNKKNKDPTRSNEDCVELTETAENEDENLQAMGTVAKTTAMDNTSTSVENTVVRNSAPFYFTLVKVDSATTDSPNHFKPIHIADDTQCPEIDRPYFILEKENADTEVKGVSNTTDSRTVPVIPEKNTSHTECCVNSTSNIDCGKNNTSHIDCGENNISHIECGENNTTNNECIENYTSHIVCGKSSGSHMEFSENNPSHIECGENNTNHIECGETNTSHIECGENK